jgi:hypothetical protein
MNRVTVATRHLASFLVLVHVSLGPIEAQTGAYCPIVPQTQDSSTTVFGGDDVLDLTGSNSKPSARLRVQNASASTIVFIDGATTHDPAALAALKKSKAQIVLKTNTGPTAARTMLTHRVETVSVLAAIPQDAAGVAATYRPETANHPEVLAEYRSIGQKLAAVPNTVIVPGARGQETVRQRLLAQASERQPASLLVVIGHNENGVLKLPDRSSLQLDELAEASAKSGRPVLVLSCDTVSANTQAAGFVTTRPLYFEEIAQALNVAFSTKTKDRTVGQFVRDVNVALATPESNARKTKIIVAVAVVGGTVLALAILNASDCGPLSREKCA